MSTLQKIIAEKHWMDGFRNLAKRQAKYFPTITKIEADDLIGYSTLVRVKDPNGKWYKVHCLETFNISYGSGSEVETIKRLVSMAHKTEFLYIPQDLRDVDGVYIDDLDECQTEEKERLLKEEYNK